ncbi:MAG: DinB family protein [Blastocatellia bacterium]|nr:DinB family protein [Blastocatellia bacterium]
MTNIVSRYRDQSEELTRTIAGCSAAAAVWRPNETQWSIMEIAGHLVDAEMIAAVRIRRILTQDHPFLYGYRQETWVRRLNHQRREIANVLARFRMLREMNAELLDSIEPADWALSAPHDTYGVMTLEAWIDDYLDHTKKHIDQIARYAIQFAAAATNNPS